MPRRKPRKRIEAIAVVEPTPELLATGEFHRVGMAHRRKPVIDSLFDAGKLSARQHAGLCRYRDVAIAEERSPIRDSIDKALHGRSEGGWSPGALHTALELGRLETALGALRDIARAVAVDDVTVARWAMGKSGAVERSRTFGGRIIALFEPRRAAQKQAMLDIRMAGERLAAAIGA